MKLIGAGYGVRRSDSLRSVVTKVERQEGQCTRDVAKGTLTNCSEKKDAIRMRLMKNKWLRIRRTIAICILAMTLVSIAMAQAVSTTTVQGTVYLANGQPGAGTLLISWPSFTTAAGQ